MTDTAKTQPRPQTPDRKTDPQPKPQRFDDWALI